MFTSRIESKLRPGVRAAAVLALVMAAVPATGDDADRGYWVDPYGNPVKTTYGECWRTTYPAEADQTEIARECGNAEAAEVAEAPEKMAAAEPKPDSDGDGVIDENDACRGTPSGREVKANGCQPDADRDGVVDARDQCAGTPRNSDVDERGCRIDPNIEVTLAGDKFGFDSAIVPASLQGKLDEVVRRIRATPGSERLQIVGHTDSVGSAEYNEELARERAQAVADYLSGRGIERSRMSVTGRGERDPIASNDTASGRADNRRVVISVE